MSKAEPLHLTMRGAMLTGVQLNEHKHGDDTVPAVYLTVEQVMLGKDELNKLLGDKHAYDALFVAAKQGGLIEPMFKRFAPFAFIEKFVDCAAQIALGIQKSTYELEDVKLKGITLEPLSGGHTAMRCMIQYEFDDAEIVGALADQLGRECSIELTFGAVDEGKKKQGQLALNSESDPPKNKFGEGEAPAATH